MRMRRWIYQRICTLPDLKRGESESAKHDGESPLEDAAKMGTQKKWGPVLVEERLRRIPRDGRTMRESSGEEKTCQSGGSQRYNQNCQPLYYFRF
jgi:hypothetical protein